jgi:hypothetical protein
VTVIERTSVTYEDHLRDKTYATMDMYPHTIPIKNEETEILSAPEWQGEWLSVEIAKSIKLAKEQGKSNHAITIQALYERSLENKDLRCLLERNLAETANDEEKLRFREYVKKEQLRARNNLSVTAPSTGPSTIAENNAVNNTVELSAGMAEADGTRPATEAELKDAQLGQGGLTGHLPPGASVERLSTDSLSRRAPHDETGASFQPKGAAEKRAVVASDSGYESPDRAPLRHPLVNEILGRLQYEPTVEKLLRYHKPPSSDSNSQVLEKWESALEAIKTILTDTPAARTDLEVLEQKLLEMDAEATDSDHLPVRQASGDAELEQSDGEDEDENNGEAEEEKEAKPSKRKQKPAPKRRRSLRSRNSNSLNTIRVSDRTLSGKRKHHWPCPMAKETGCTDMFTKSDHALRHGKVHTGVREFICPACHKLFARKDNMTAHLANVHRNRVGKQKRESRSSTVDTEQLLVTEASSEPAPKRRRSARHVLNTNSHTTRSARKMYSEETSSPVSEPPSESSPELQDADHDDAVCLRSVSTSDDRRREENTVQPEQPELSELLLSILAAPIPVEPGDGTLSRKDDQSEATTPSPDAVISSAERLRHIADSLKDGVLSQEDPEVIQLVAAGVRKAAEAVLEACNTAARSAELARDTAMTLENTTELAASSRQAQQIDHAIGARPLTQGALPDASWGLHPAKDLLWTLGHGSFGKIEGMDDSEVWMAVWSRAAMELRRLRG